MKKLLSVTLFVCVFGGMLSGAAFSQPSVAVPAAITPKQYLPMLIKGRGDSANESVPPYDGAFQYGLNPGYYGNGWDDRGIHKLRYVLWARTNKDRDETAGATISLPGSYAMVKWDGTTSTVSGTNIALTGAPVFLTRQ